MKKDDMYERMRARIKKWAESKEGESNKWVEYILLLPDLLHLFCALILDPDIPAAKKAQLGMVVAYIISPIDLIPEGLLGPVGLVDDLALAAFVINQLINEVDESVVLRHWKGEGDLLAIVRNLVATADEMIGSGLWERLKAMVKGKA
jgi:uncharacterized membrane protein YkvA (DUF1232 family)